MDVSGTVPAAEAAFALGEAVARGLPRLDRVPWCPGTVSWQVTSFGLPTCLPGPTDAHTMGHGITNQPHHLKQSPEGQTQV